MDVFLCALYVVFPLVSAVEFISAYNSRSNIFSAFKIPTYDKKFFLLAFVALTLQGLSQTLDNYQKAFSILEKARVTIGSQVHDNILVFTKGTIHSLGHYDVPEKTIDLPIEENYGFFAKEDAAYLFGKMQSSGNTYQRAATSKKDSLYEIGYYDQNFTKMSTADFVFQAAKALPSQLLQLAFKNRKSLRYLGEQAPYHLLSFNYAGQESATLYVHQQRYLLEKVETLGYHNLYGDVVFATECKNFSDNEGMKIPQKRIDCEFGKIEREVTYNKIEIDAKPDKASLKISWHQRLLGISWQPLRKSKRRLFLKLSPPILT